MAVYELLVKLYAFALKRLQDKVVNGPERVFRERTGAQAVLVAHHDELEVEMSRYEREVADHAVHKFQLLKSVDLLVGRFFYQRAVTIDEEHTLLLVCDVIHSCQSFLFSVLFYAIIFEHPLIALALQSLASCPLSEVACRVFSLVSTVPQA